jgi:hypothetical protein
MDEPIDFPTTEPIMFGETLNQLPNLSKWKLELTKKMKPNHFNDSYPRREKESENADPSFNITTNEKQNKKRISISDIAIIDDSYDISNYNSFHQPNINSVYNKHKLKPKFINSSSNIEILREESRLAYQQLKSKRSKLLHS